MYFLRIKYFYVFAALGTSLLGVAGCGDASHSKIKSSAVIKRSSDAQVLLFQENFEVATAKVLTPKGINAKIEVVRFEKEKADLPLQAETTDNIIAAEMRLRLTFTSKSPLLVAEAFRKSFARDLHMRIAFEKNKYSYFEFFVGMDVLLFLKNIEGQKVTMEEFATYIKGTDQFHVPSENYRFDEKTQTLYVKDFLLHDKCDSNFVCSPEKYGARMQFNASEDIRDLSNALMGILIAGQDVDELSMALQDFVDLINIYNPAKLQIPNFEY